MIFGWKISLGNILKLKELILKFSKVKVDNETLTKFLEDDWLDGGSFGS